MDVNLFCRAVQQVGCTNDKIISNTSYTGRLFDLFEDACIGFLNIDSVEEGFYLERQKVNQKK